MYKIIYQTLLIFILLAFVTPAMAYNTGWKVSSSGGVLSGGGGSIILKDDFDKTNSDDNDPLHLTSSDRLSAIIQGSGLENIASPTASINGVWVKVKVKTSPDPSAKLYKFRFGMCASMTINSTTAIDIAPTSSTDYQTFTQYIPNQEGVCTTVNMDNYNSSNALYGFYASDISMTTEDIDYMAMALDYGSHSSSYNELFKINLDEERIATSEGKVYLSMSGTFENYGENVECTQWIHHKYSQFGDVISGFDTTVVAVDYKGWLPSTETVKIAEDSYTGISDLSTSPDWEFNEVAVPYMFNADNEYPVQYKCWNTGTDHTEATEIEVKQGLYPDNSNYSASMSASPAIVQNTPALADVVCGDDLICKLGLGIKSTLAAIFIPKFTLIRLHTKSELYSLFEAKAPMAYVVPFFDLDTSDPTTTSAMPLLRVPYITDNTGVVHYAEPNVDQNTILSGLFAIIRTTTRGFLYVIFLLYLVSLVRRSQRLLQN